MSEKPVPAAVLIWGSAEKPTMEQFAASSATTFSSLSDAVIHAVGELPTRERKPWILVEDTMFSPDQIRVLAETLAVSE